ncbi:hypothetical protein N665_0135s0001 [Sinapis alba]|nr:hypothetical protein N665_1461s0001 [Sinapis alba]KAF8106656.1 hypothetical protein N665_0135s0001 [Sinapis alba]
MGRKSSAACAAWCAEACLQLSSLSSDLCGSKPLSEATPHVIKHHLLSSGRPLLARKTIESSEKIRERREKIQTEKSEKNYGKIRELNWSMADPSHHLVSPISEVWCM